MFKIIDGILAHISETHTKQRSLTLRRYVREGVEKLTLIIMIIQWHLDNSEGNY